MPARAAQWVIPALAAQRGSQHLRALQKLPHAILAATLAPFPLQLDRLTDHVLVLLPCPHSPQLHHDSLPVGFLPRADGGDLELAIAVHGEYDRLRPPDGGGAAGGGPGGAMRIERHPGPGGDCGVAPHAWRGVDAVVEHPVAGPGGYIIVVVAYAGEHLPHAASRRLGKR